MKKLLIAGLLLSLYATLMVPVRGENLVLYTAYQGGSEFYVDIDSFHPGNRDGELYYYVYGFTPHRQTVTLNAVDCKRGKFRSYLKSWRIKPNGEQVLERSVSPTPVTLRRGYLYGLLRGACEANTSLTLNW